MWNNKRMSAPVTGTQGEIECICDDRIGYIIGEISFWHILNIQQRTPKGKCAVTYAMALRWFRGDGCHLTWRNSWMQPIADWCTTELCLCSVAPLWTCASPLKIKKKNIQLTWSMESKKRKYPPLTCCTDVSFFSQWSSNGCGAVVSSSEVYCLIPLAVV